MIKLEGNRSSKKSVASSVFPIERKNNHVQLKDDYFKRTSLEAITHRKLSSIISAMRLEPGDLHQAVMQSVERPLILLVLQKANGNQTKAASMLGINRNTLRKKIDALGLDPEACHTETEI